MSMHDLAAINDSE